MSEYDIRCVNCFHKSHEGKECPYCPLPSKDNPNSRCKEFVRADLFMARSMARLEQAYAQTHGQIMMGLSAIFDLLQEAYPEAATRLKEALEKRQKAAEEAIEMERTQRLAEADAALSAANEAEERRKLEALAESYQKKDNVIPFPGPKEVPPEGEPDPDPGVANG